MTHQRRSFVVVAGLLWLGLAWAQEDDPEELRYASKLSAYEPAYFSVGWRGDTNARFQLSFKYRFLNPEGSLAERSPLLCNLHLGYTQNSLWDLQANSEPFRDSSYKPSLFYLKERIEKRPAWISRYDLQVGVEHESNGKNEPDSRSINIAFVRPLFVFGEREHYRLTVAPRAWFYFGGRSDNPDIADYRGYVDLHLAYGKYDSWKFASHIRRGNEKHYGSIQIDVSYPMDRILLRNLEAYLHVQYFNGWGESILDYNRKLESQLRFGFMIVR